MMQRVEQGRAMARRERMGLEQQQQQHRSGNSKHSYRVSFPHLHALDDDDSGMRGMSLVPVRMIL